MKTKQKISLLRVSSVMLVLLILLGLCSVLSLAVGSAGYSIQEILKALFSQEDSPVKTNRPQSPFAPHYSGNFDWFLPFGSRSIAAVGNEKPTGRPGYNRCFGRCRNSSYHHTPDFSTIECFGSIVCLWRSGFGVRPDLYDGMEGRRGPDADYSVRCCDQLGFGSV